MYWINVQRKKSIRNWSIRKRANILRSLLYLSALLSIISKLKDTTLRNSTILRLRLKMSGLNSSSTFARSAITSIKKHWRKNIVSTFKIWSMSLSNFFTRCKKRVKEDSTTNTSSWTNIRTFHANVIISSQSCRGYAMPRLWRSEMTGNLFTLSAVRFFHCSRVSVRKWVMGKNWRSHAPIAMPKRSLTSQEHLYSKIRHRLRKL